VIRRALTVVAVAMLVSSVAPAATGAQEDVQSWIVTVKRRARGVDRAAAMVAGVEGELDHVFSEVMTGFSFTGTASAAEALAENPMVRSVEPDGIVHITEAAPSGIARIAAAAAHDSGYVGVQPNGTPVRIAIADTGIMLNHPDLAANVDASAGINCIDQTKSPADDHGHGTHVSGIAAAALNGVGVVGGAPGATLVPIKVIDATGNGTDSQVICGLDHVLALHDADGVPTVVNMSLGEARSEGTGCNSSPLHQSICELTEAGIVVVAAIGNDSSNGSNFYPAAFPETIAVSAFTDLDGTPAATGCQFKFDVLFQCDETLASFTNYGPKVDVAAPGTWINSTTLGGGYGLNSGTSMASPHVAGVAALVLGANPGLLPAEVKDILRTTGECPNGTEANAATCAGKGQWQVAGFFGGTTPDPDGIPEPLVNALRAVEAAEGTVPGDARPSVTVTAPAAGAVVSGTSVAVSANASDDVGVSQVEFRIDGAVIGTDTSAPYGAAWDTTSVSDSPHAVEAVATDTIGQSRSAHVDVVVDNAPPAVAISSPLDGETVSGTYAVTANAADPSGITRVDFAIDGNPLAVDASAPFDVSWDTTTVNDGQHTVSATAVDATGAQATAMVTVTVDQSVPSHAYAGFLGFGGDGRWGQDGYSYTSATKSFVWPATGRYEVAIDVQVGSLIDDRPLWGSFRGQFSREAVAVIRSNGSVEYRVSSGGTAWNATLATPPGTLVPGQRIQLRLVHDANTVTWYTRDPLTVDKHLGQSGGWTQVAHTTTFSVTPSQINNASAPFLGFTRVGNGQASGMAHDLFELRILVDDTPVAGFTAESVPLDTTANTWTDDNTLTWQWAGHDPTQVPG
jgi:Subtilase family/Bacterial Ig domain/Peptidase inhibitor I9